MQKKDSEGTLVAVMIDEESRAKQKALHEDEKVIPTEPVPIWNVAHRGASGHAPEHTIEGYRMGGTMLGDFIEVDLQMTKDGVLVAMHDERVDRTTNGTGLVKDFTLEELKKLDAGSWFNDMYPHKAQPHYVGLTVPTLEEIIQEFGTDERYYIETKEPGIYPGMEEELIRVLEKYKLIGKDPKESHVLIQSFSPESLQKLHDLNSIVPLVRLFTYFGIGTITDKELDEIDDYAVGIGANHNGIDEKYVRQVVDAGLMMHPYTVNTKDDMRKVIDWGVTGMFTNFPDLLRDVLKEYEEAS
ncbi:glycerophosphodiester phosphodiesterase [Indiicoccus explosivorum]|uniref:glycerophosphodiester phosphodiesterase n=1 Tax=Indiicoccus explosivorum TaxID=1917864 RepID=UPI000B4440FE|nr:glycerophosphodiester phosphodiesterase [Indiicoccus explosivorum]